MDLPGLYEAAAPWAVLATGVLITACARQHFPTIELLSTTVQYAGTIQQQAGARAAQMIVPNWFPIVDSIIETSGGEIYSRLRDVSLEVKTAADDKGNLYLTIDLSKAPLRPETNAFTLTYSPWFRFVTEPVGFNIRGRMAAYVGECFRFLLARSGVVATVVPKPDGCDLEIPLGLRIEIRGMEKLTKISLHAGDAVSVFDLAGFSLEIDQRMFPAAFEAGCAFLKTEDRLLRMTAVQNGTRFTLTNAPGVTHV